MVTTTRRAQPCRVPVLNVPEWVRHYSEWAAERGLETNLARVPKANLDGILQQFYAELLKKNGQEYKPESLKMMQAGLTAIAEDVTIVS